MNTQTKSRKPITIEDFQSAVSNNNSVRAKRYLQEYNLMRDLALLHRKAPLGKLYRRMADANYALYVHFKNVGK
jgi:hypothetical protein